MRYVGLLALGLASAVFAAANQSGVKGYAYCYARLNGQELVTQMFPWPDKEDVGYEIEGNWKYYLRKSWGMRDGNLVDCSMSSSKSDADRYYAIYLQRSGAQVVDFIPLPKARKAPGTTKTPEVATSGSTEPERQSADSGSTAAGKTRADYEAEWQAKLDAYEAEKRAWEAKVAAQKAEEERQKAAHAAAQQEAAKVQAAHEKKMQGHVRLIEEYTKRQMDYEAAKSRHTACVNGDKSACAAIAEASNPPPPTGGRTMVGFGGPTCEAALRGAQGPGAQIAGSTFEEVDREVLPNWCIVKGYVTVGHGAVTRQ